MKKDNWWKISLVLSLIQMILFGYLDFILANTDWFFSFGFIVFMFISLLLVSVILIALKKRIGYKIGYSFHYWVLWSEVRQFFYLYYCIIRELVILILLNFYYLRRGLSQLYFLYLL